MPRRKPGAVLPVERAILQNGAQLLRRQAVDGEEMGFHGFGVAQAMKERGASDRLAAYGTVYKALARMENSRWVEGRWEDPERARMAKRPPRKLYTITDLGYEALATAAASEQGAAHKEAVKSRPATAGP